MDYLGPFDREVAAFEAAGREAVSCQAAAAVPWCPGRVCQPTWSTGFQAGAAELAELFRAPDLGERVWPWSADHSVGFWQRMQAIEAAVHRWDAQHAVIAAQPIDADLAAPGRDRQSGCAGRLVVG